MRLPHVASLWVPVAVGLLSMTTLVAQSRPLPDKESFLRDVRGRLRTDSSLQSSYIYTETRREQKIDSSGKVKEESVKVYESYPGLPGEGRWDRLISEDGRRRPAAELEKEMRERQKKAETLARAVTEQPAQEKARQERKAAEDRREFEAILDDVMRVFDVRLERRETVSGYETILVSLTPRPDSKPRTREGGQMKSFNVRAWINESDSELVRVEAEAIDSVSLGFGLLARLHKGAKLEMARTRVNNEVWLPLRMSYSASARVALLAVLRRAGISEFSGYRKFSVDTSTTYQPSTP